MNLRFSKVTGGQLEEIFTFYRQINASKSVTEEQLELDVEDECLYRVEHEGMLVAVFALEAAAALNAEIATNGPFSWLYGIKPAALRHLAFCKDCDGTELATRVLSFVKDEAKHLRFDSLRVCVCRADEHLLATLAEGMARVAGNVIIAVGNATQCTCFETPLSATCPMLPIRMHPAYRCGEMTPWGGDGLRRVFHKEIPDERTGEAMEISTIPKLESKSDADEELSALIATNGVGLMGNDAEFPLLLKLLAAREPLSVQVHPSDDYAREHENKLGKTEAWVILHAEEGATILYGMKDGTSSEALRKALQSNEDIEPMIERVMVHEGDVFYMPSGMVHAIGAGIVLYEIQQSSDVTYRLWDYNRTNVAGEKRPLHIQQSLDVIDMTLRGARAQMPEAGSNQLVNLLTVPAFTLDCACVNDELMLQPNPQGFRMLTVLAELKLCWQGDEMALNAGDSVLLPASCPEVGLVGTGRALISKVSA